MASGDVVYEATGLQLTANDFASDARNSLLTTQFAGGSLTTPADGVEDDWQPVTVSVVMRRQDKDYSDLEWVDSLFSATKRYSVKITEV